MLKVLLVCSAGMSTSLLVNKVKDAAVKRGIEIDIKAIPEAGIANEPDLETISLILLSPAVRFQLDSIKELIADKMPVDVIEMKKYGMMDGEGVLDDILTLVGKV